MEWGTSSEKLNAEMFPTYYPPFTPNRPYVHVRVRPGQTLSLVRAYGGGALPGGAFFFPARSNYMKSSIEARDTGALPDKNTTEKWIKVTFGEGEDFYVGAINPQILTNGANIPDFGRGGLGGEIQYWRDGRGKPHWTLGQAGSEVPTIQNPKLQKAQQILREQVGTGEDQNWPRAEQIYKEARERAAGSDSTLRSDLKKMEAELWRFHHVNYVRQLDNLLTYLRLPSFDRQYIETKAIDRFHDFSERDKKYNPLPSPNWIEMLKWQQLVRKEFTAKVDEYYSTGKIPEKIRVPPIPPKDIPKRPLTAEDRQFLDHYLDNGHDW